MNKYIIPILVVLLLVSSSFIAVSITIEKPSIQSFKGKILYVGGGGEGNYTHIKDAVNDAEDGDTVFVYNGWYTEGFIPK